MRMTPGSDVLERSIHCLPLTSMGVLPPPRYRRLMRAREERSPHRTDATVTLRPVDGLPSTNKIALEQDGREPGIDAAAFVEHAQASKARYPVSRALAGVPEITLEESLTADS